jgi:peptidoglycan/LPS O-acetylase OafA/YrhL
MDRNNKLSYIDALRGIAILMVILRHVGLNVKVDNFLMNVLIGSGQMGVQMFFVASAFTLCLSSSNRLGEKGHIKKFFLRRYFRIAPIYYLGILTYFIVTLIDSKFKTGHFIIAEYYTIENIFKNVFFINGLFKDGNNNVVPGGWSIGTEMIFYFIFPFLFSFCNKHLNSFIKIFFFILIGLGISFCFLLIMKRAGQSITNNSFAYFNIFNQISVFFVGIAYFFITKYKMYSFKENKKNLLLFFIIFCLAKIVWHIKNDLVMSIVPFLYAVSFTFIFEFFKYNNKINAKWLLDIGKASYTLYITHFIFATFLTFYINQYVPSKSVLMLIIIYISNVTVSYLFQKYTFKYFEQWGIDLGRNIIKRLP